jgi:hypothetical protein
MSRLSQEKKMSRHTGPILPRSLLASAICIGICSAAPAAAHDYPTYERVQYAIQCMVSHGGAQDLIYKCSCAIDKIAAQYSIDDFVDMQTAINASTIAGQRGGELRDNPEIRDAAKRYRQAEQAALQSCGVAVR